MSKLTAAVIVTVALVIAAAAVLVAGQLGDDGDSEQEAETPVAVSDAEVATQIRDHVGAGTISDVCTARTSPVGGENLTRDLFGDLYEAGLQTYQSAEAVDLPSTAEAYSIVTSELC